MTPMTPSAVDAAPALIDRYLDLMKKCLTDDIYGYHRVGLEIQPRGGYSPRNLVRSTLLKVLRSRGFALVQKWGIEQRERGSTWPEVAHTMVGLKRLDHLQACIEDVLRDNVPGDLIETGVWRGGATIFMRAVLAAYGDRERTVWAADSFEGLPPPNPDTYPADRGDRYHEADPLRVSVEEVRRNFETYDLLDGQVRFLKGWFRDTLTTAPIERLSILRLDGDMYESTWDALVNLHPKVTTGGYVIVDDYYAVAGCREAVHDYRRTAGLSEPIWNIPDTADGVFWRRGASSPRGADAHRL